MNRILISLACLFVVAGVGTAFFFGGSSQPQDSLYFGHVVFGREKTPETTKQFIVRGRQIFIDENQDQFPQPSEELTQPSDHVIREQGSETEFKFASFDVGVSPDLVSEARPQKLILYVDIVDKFAYQMTGQIELSTTAAPTRYLHFGGPLEFLALDEIELRDQSSEPQDVKIYLGTSTAIPTNTTVVAPNEQPPFPDAVIHFELENGETTSQKFAMDHFC